MFSGVTHQEKEEPENALQREEPLAPGFSLYAGLGQV